MKLSKRSFHTTFGDEENQSGNMTSCLNQLEIKSTGNIKRSNSRINLTFKKPKYDLDDSSVVSESNNEAGHATSIEDKDDTTPLSSLQGTAKKRNVR